MTATATSQQPVHPRNLLTRQQLLSGPALVGALALVSFAGHMAVANNYGYFRDELYYMAGGRHLAPGYVDYPFLIALLAAVMRVLAGDNLVAIHVIPALAGACQIVVTGLLARELGGGRFAQVVAALASMFALVFMATASIFSMDILDGLWWSLGAYILVRLIRRDQPRLWLLFGLVAGIGLTTKLTMLFFGFGLVVGLLLTPARRVFSSRWIWLGGAIAFVGLVPYILWNAATGWPTVEFWRHYGGLSGGGPVGFLANQVLALNPLTLPLSIAGLFFYFRTAAGRPYRALGWSYVALYLLFTLINAKPYFLAPAYPILFAAGALVVERALGRARVWRWAIPAYVGAFVLLGVYLAPVAMPILPPATYAANYRYLTGLGNGGAGQSNVGVFPQYLGDRFGWDTMTASVARVYRGLPPTEQAQACIFTANYGEASALSFLGVGAHLPPVISGHNNYYLWGPGTCDGQVIITVGLSQQDNQQSFASVSQAATITCAYCQPEENDIPVYICTQPKSSVRDLWRSVKHFN